MKKFGLFALVFLLAQAFAACGGSTAPEPSLTAPEVQSSYANEADDQQQEEVQLGFSISGEGAFFDQLQSDIEAACAQKGYTFSLLRSQTALDQQNDIMTLLGSGISALVIGPADVDAMESVLAECESDGVPVININDPINGKVSTLVSPDYTLVGQYAAQRALSLFGETGARCMELKTDYDGFIMQLLSDGFANKLAENDKLILASELYCGDDEEQAYQLTKEELLAADEGIVFIFAQSSTLARGTMRAVEETGSEAKLVVFSGDMDMISAVEAGSMDAAIFIGPKELADIAVENAGRYIGNPSFIPDSFIQLHINVVMADNAADYLTDELTHAQLKED